MADTTTTNLGLTKPGVGDPAGIDAWGGKLNNNLDLIDALFGGWKHLNRAKIVSPVSAIETTIPAGTTALRISGTFRSATTAQLVMQLSWDGVTYKTGGTDYRYSYTLQSGSAVTAGTNISNNAMFVATNVNSTITSCRPFTTHMSIPTDNTVYPQLISQNTGYDGSGATLITFSGMGFTAGPPLKMRLLPTSGNIEAGTDITVERLS